MQNILTIRIFFIVFEFITKVLFFPVHAIWISMIHLYPSGLITLWTGHFLRKVYYNEAYILYCHIRHYKLLQIIIAEMNSVTGNNFVLFILAISAMSGVLCIFCGIRFQDADLVNYIFYICVAICTMLAIQTVFLLNGLVYDATDKYLKFISRKIHEDQGTLMISKLVKKLVRSLKHSGITLGPLPYTKRSYVIRFTSEIFNCVVSLLIVCK